MGTIAKWRAAWAEASLARKTLISVCASTILSVLGIAMLSFVTLSVVKLASPGTDATARPDGASVEMPEGVAGAAKATPRKPKTIGKNAPFGGASNPASEKQESDE